MLKNDLASLKSDINKFKKVPIGLNSLKSKVNQLDVDKLEPVPVDLIKLGDVVEKEIAKKMYKMNWLKMFMPLIFDAAAHNAVENKIPNVIDTVTKRKIMMQKLRTNILLLRIIINLRMIYCMQR